MKFTVSSTTLSGCLQALARVFNSKNTVPILNDFLFEVKGETLTVTASDGENVIKSNISIVEADSTFSFCLLGKTIMDSVKEFAEEPLTFEVNLSEQSAIIKYHNGKIRIPLHLADPYPRVQNDAEPMTDITVDAGSLEKTIGRSIFATAQDDLRPVMNGLYFDLKSDNLTIVASDGHKLVRNENFAIKGNEPASFILPKKIATHIKSLLSKEGEVNIKFSTKIAVVTFENYEVTCRLIEGKYPNYNSVIPLNNPNEVTIDRQLLLGALKRVLVFASQSSYLIRFNLSQSKLGLSSEDVDYSTSADEELTCDYFGSPMSIGFKGTSMIEILSNMDCESVILKLADPSRAGIIVPAREDDNDSQLMLIMPMLLND